LFVATVGLGVVDGLDVAGVRLGMEGGELLGDLDATFLVDVLAVAEGLASSSSPDCPL